MRNVFLHENNKNIGVLGIGNLLLADEGFGVHVIHYLEEHFSFPENVRLHDGGTAGIYMAPFFEEVDRLIVIDVLALEDEPGSIHCFGGTDLQGANVQLRMSPHQLGILEVLEICKLRDQAPEEVQFIGVVPKTVDTSMELSDVLAAKVAEVAEMVVDLVKEVGIDARNIPGAGSAQTA